MANVLTPMFRVSYPSVFKPKHNELNGKEEFSVVALFPKGADLSGMKKAAEEALTEEFGTDKKKWPKNIRSPFRLQEEKEKDGELPPGHEKGAVFMTYRSTQKPGLVDQKKEDIIDSSDFYGGCFARALVNAKAYNIKGNAGVSFYLQHLQKIKDGEAFGSRVKVEDAFEAIDMSDEDGDASTSKSMDKDATSVFN